MVVEEKAQSFNGRDVATDGLANGDIAPARPMRLWVDAGLKYLPGLVLTTAIAAFATLIRTLPVASMFSAMILAAIIGMCVRGLFGIGHRAQPGIVVAMRVPLRVAIVLLGLQMTFLQATSIGKEAFAVAILSLIGTFIFIVMLGRVMNVERGVTYLLATGTSICGAAAIIAANSVVKSKDEDVIYAVGCITVFGTVAMLLYPLLASALSLTAAGFGVWSGASIHEIGQVVGASFQYSQTSGEVGTITKLTRVVMLAPLMLFLPFLVAQRPAAKTRTPIPWFVLGFILVVALNSTVTIPAEVTAKAGTVMTFLFAVALAAMGVQTDFRMLRACGVRPLALCAIGTLFIALLSLLLIKWFMLK